MCRFSCNRQFVSCKESGAPIILGTALSARENACQAKPTSTPTPQAVLRKPSSAAAPAIPAPNREVSRDPKMRLDHQNHCTTSCNGMFAPGDSRRRLYYDLCANDSLACLAAKEGNKGEEARYRRLSEEVREQISARPRQTVSPPSSAEDDLATCKSPAPETSSSQGTLSRPMERLGQLPAV